MIGPGGRGNICFEVRILEQTTNKLELALKMIEEKKYDGAIIIFCSTRKKWEDMKIVLNAAGIGAVTYHGDLNSDQKQASMEAWMKDDPPIICATSALGNYIYLHKIITVIYYKYIT